MPTVKKFSTKSKELWRLPLLKAIYETVHYLAKASKAGLSMSVALYAQRLARSNIQVFEIRPGIIRTDMISAVEKSYDERIANGLLPQSRMGEPSDIARAVRAIAEGHLDYSTGQVLNVDGGFHLRSL